MTQKSSILKFINTQLVFCLAAGTALLPNIVEAQGYNPVPRSTERVELPRYTPPTRYVPQRENIKPNNQVRANTQNGQTGPVEQNVQYQNPLYQPPQNPTGQYGDSRQAQPQPQQNQGYVANSNTANSYAVNGNNGYPNANGYSPNSSWAQSQPARNPLQNSARQFDARGSVMTSQGNQGQRGQIIQSSGQVAQNGPVAQNEQIQLGTRNEAAPSSLSINPGVSGTPNRAVGAPVGRPANTTSAPPAEGYHNLPPLQVEGRAPKESVSATVQLKTYTGTDFQKILVEKLGKKYIPVRDMQ
ncbi:MAG: hypothetical protein ACRC2T_00330, partial [Thermoguttaceae bacterium]